MSDYKEKIKAMEPISAINKLLDEVDTYLPSYDSLTNSDRKEIINDWLESLNKEEVKELSHYLNLIYFSKVRAEKIKEERNTILQNRLEDYPWEKEESDG